MAVETFLPIDILMDLSILCAVQLALGRLRPARLIASLLCMLGFTLLAYLGRAPAYLIAILQLPLCLGAGAILTGARSLRSCMHAAAGILAGGFCAAGFASAVQGATPLRLCAAAAGAGLASWLLRRKRHMRLHPRIELCVELCGARASFPALIDTGNCLREPVSGLPVLIVEAAQIAGPAGMAWLERFDRMRHVRYGALGGGGECPCFMPDRVMILSRSGDMLPAPQCWVAIYPGSIPGRICALAPPEFADAAGR